MEVLFNQNETTNIGSSGWKKYVFINLNISSKYIKALHNRKLFEDFFITMRAGGQINVSSDGVPEYYLLYKKKME